MRLPLPSVNELFGLPAKSYEAVETALSLIPRVVTVIGRVETLLGRVETLIGGIEHTQAGAAAAVLRTNEVVTSAAGLTSRLTPLIDRLQPTLETLEPILRELAATTSHKEVAGMVAIVDLVPEIALTFKTDIIPVIDTLGTVAPDLRDLLDMARELSEILGAVPGLGRVKRKIEEKQAQEDEYRADEEPPSAPDRQPVG